MTFTSIDFELATADYTSVCAVGVIKVAEGEIVEQFHSLIRPPDNQYMWQTTRVHGISSKDTQSSPTFLEIYPEIERLLKGQKMVAHNESFDRSVLQKTMLKNGLNYASLSLPNKWECTSQIYRSLGFPKTKLNICCQIMGIDLEHHEALSDARACALLYLNIEKAKELVADLESLD